MCKVNKKIIGILDYGIGNIGSIKNMLTNVTVNDVLYIDNPDQLGNIDKLIIPGVGAYDSGVNLLSERGLYEGVRYFALKEKKSTLGICLGMQLLGNKSEEGTLKGLGLIDFDVKKFGGDGLKVPHMGWNYVKFKKPSPLTLDFEELEKRFYFVHSYYAVCNNQDNILMTCEYGKEFVAAVCRENIYGVQFHPEKSHIYGMQLLKNFIEVC